MSTDEKAALAKENGAEIVIVYKKEKLIDRVLEITKGEGVAAVYDGVGKSTYVDSVFYGSHSLLTV